MEVEVKHGNIEAALWTLRKAVNKDGILREIRERERNPNRYDRKRHKQRLAAKRRLRMQRRKVSREEGRV